MDDSLKNEGFLDMAFSPLEQAVRAIQNASRILITLPKHPTIDSQVSGAALEKLLSLCGKEVTILCEEFSWPKRLSFLPAPHIESQLEFPTYHISVNLHDGDLKNISYALYEKKLHIFIETNTHLNEQDVYLPPAFPFFDLIIFLGMRDSQTVGKIFGEYYHLLSNTPILNIDCSPENEGMGHLHLTDITAPSISELLFPLFELLGKEYITEEIATFLLSGIIDQTRAFRTPHIPPKTLRTSSLLMKYGADREKIITAFYRTRTVSTLKLWGKILSRLEHDTKYHLAWSRVYHEDFIATQSKSEDLWEIIDEVIMNIPQLSAVLLFYEREDKTFQGIISIVHPLLLPKQILPDVPIQGNRRLATFPLEAENILEGERAIIQKIKFQLEKMHND